MRHLWMIQLEFGSCNCESSEWMFQPTIKKVRKFQWLSNITSNMWFAHVAKENVGINIQWFLRFCRKQSQMSESWNKMLESSNHRNDTPTVLKPRIHETCMGAFITVYTIVMVDHLVQITTPAQSKANGSLVDQQHTGLSMEWVCCSLNLETAFDTKVRLVNESSEN